MNAPNFSFDPDNLPSIARSSPLPAREGYPVYAKSGDEFNGQDEVTSDYRRLFFMMLGLSLKYRWLIAGICTVAVVIGFFLTFTSTPIYRATTVIQIDRLAPRVVKFGS